MTSYTISSVFCLMRIWMMFSNLYGISYQRNDILAIWIRQLADKVDQQFNLLFA